MSKAHNFNLIVTTGDPDGIGDEVTYKALLQSHFAPQAIFVVMTTHPQHPLMRRLRARVVKKYSSRVYASLAAALSDNDPPVRVRFVENGAPSPLWVEEGALACLEKKAAALVTAPLSKTLIRDSGLHDVGHTEILARVCGVEKNAVRMAFIGQKFNVVLATGHLPLKDVASHVTAASLFTSLKLASEFRSCLPARTKHLPVALVALNPHAGDDQLIGKEETTIFRDALARAISAKLHVIGPLVPDAAFLPENWRRFSVYVCPYHDQGLIPFKAIHGHESGAHTTLGLPIIRTSVDHGTAKDLYGKNKAGSQSMLEAIAWALRFARINRN